MRESFVLVIKETHLSRRPDRGSGVSALASVAVLILLSATYWLDLFGLASILPATGEQVFDRGEYWRLATSIGIHADVRHLLANSIVFGVLSFLLYGYYGPVVYPIASWGLGSLVTGLALLTYPPQTALVGASGVVYLMAGFWLILYLLIERRLSRGKRLLRSLGFGLIVLAPTAWDPSVSYRTHGLGFAAGVVFGMCYFFTKKEIFRRAEQIEWE